MDKMNGWLGTLLREKGVDMCAAAAPCPSATLPRALPLCYLPAPTVLPSCAILKIIITDMCRTICHWHS